MNNLSLTLPIGEKRYDENEYWNTWVMTSLVDMSILKVFSSGFEAGQYAAQYIKENPYNCFRISHGSGYYVTYKLDPAYFTPGPGNSDTVNVQHSSMTLSECSHWINADKNSFLYTGYKQDQQNFLEGLGNAAVSKTFWIS